MQQKLINTNNTVSRKKLPEPSSEQIMSNLAIYPDTCYLLDIVKSRRSILEDISYLSKKGTVILMKQVLEEFKSNLVSKNDFRQEKSHALNELSMLYSLTYENKNILIEDHVCSDKEMDSYANVMKANSDFGNSRVGAGEAAIISHIKSVMDLFDSFVILSRDSDVPVLTEIIPNAFVTSSFL